MNEEDKLKTQEQPHSVKWGINKSGELSGECKVYSDDPDQALAKASEILVKMEELIKLKNGLVD